MGASDLEACVLTKPFTDLQLKRAVLAAAVHMRETSDRDANKIES